MSFFPQDREFSASMKRLPVKLGCVWPGDQGGRSFGDPHLMEWLRSIDVVLADSNHTALSNSLSGISYAYRMVLKLWVRGFWTALVAVLKSWGAIWPAGGAQARCIKALWVNVQPRSSRRSLSVSEIWEQPPSKSRTDGIQTRSATSPCYRLVQVSGYVSWRSSVVEIHSFTSPIHH